MIQGVGGTCASEELENSLGKEVFEEFESNVRSYCRSTPFVFTRASGSELFDVSERRFIDFLSAAGSLNYGHNDRKIMMPIQQYIADGGILQTLDFMTVAKRSFIESLREHILLPRSLDYKIQFTGPTGTNAVEAAIKLARKYTARTEVAAFTNAYHGMSLGALSVTGNSSKRAGAGVPLGNAARLPYDGYFGSTVDTAAYARTLYEDPSSGYEPPAAFIVETVQGEGGLNVASSDWMREIARLAKDLGSLLVVDDIQAGCGRTGTFFSFEQVGITPDIVCLSKSISGSGLPMAIVLMRPELDVWSPGEHNGTFRGNNLAFIGAAAALNFWADPEFQEGIATRSTLIRRTLERIAVRAPERVSVRGRGMFMGLCFNARHEAEATRAIALAEGVIAETSGPRDEVLKIMPPLNIPLPLLEEGLAVLEHAAEQSVEDVRATAILMD